MTAPKRAKRSAYPKTLDELVDAARGLPNPSQRRVMAALHIGAPKARQVLDELARTRLHLVDPDAPESVSEPAPEMHPEPSPDTSPDAPESAPEPAGKGEESTPISKGSAAPEPAVEAAPDPVPEPPTPAAEPLSAPPAPDANPGPEPQPTARPETPARRVPVMPEVEPAATSATAPAVRPSTRLLVWLALLAGIAASLAANVMHAQPGTGPRLASAWAPVALLLCVSVLERAPRHQNRAVAALSVAGMVVVAAVAAIVSYQHQYSLLVRFGETPLAATLLPVSVDGLLTVASLALLAMRGGRR